MGECRHGWPEYSYCEDCFKEAEARGFERGVREALEIAERREVVSWSVASAIRARIRSLLPPSDETPHTPPTPGGANKETD